MKNETLISPLDGTICNIKVGPHDHVYAGQNLLGIRDKRMLHLITAQAEADVDQLMVSEGQVVVCGAPLVALHEDTTPRLGRFREGDPNDASTWRLL